MVERIIEYSASNKFLVFLLVLSLAGWGVWALSQIPLDAIPDLSDVQVILVTEWPGRSPDIMEDQVTYPIVTSMIAAPQVQYVRGVSDFGFSYVYVIFEDGTDLYWARSRVLEYVSKIEGKLPPGVTPVVGPDATGVGWVFEYALVDETGRHDLAQLRSLQDWSLKYWLESVPGVAEVASMGGFVKRYNVDVDPDRLLAYNIPLDKVIRAVRESNRDVGGGSIETSGTEFMVRGRGYIKSLDDIRNIAVGHDQQGTPIFVADVAHVSMGPDMRRGIVELDGRGEAVGGAVVMRYGENALTVIERVKEKLAEIEPSLPEGVRVVPTYDRSQLISGAVGTLREVLLEEGIIVALISLVFLFHLRSALVAIIILPIAVLLAFIPMYYLRISSNIMSLGGMAIAIGEMVDAVIVMVENAHKRLEEEGGKRERKEVIVEAAKEVGPPLFFSLLVIAVSFVPIFSLTGQEGRLFKPLAWTKTLAMLFASFLSVVLAPPLMLLLIRGRITPEERNPVSRLLMALYRPFVRIALRFRKTLVFLAVVALLLTVPIYRRLGSEFMPPLNEGTILYMPTTLPGLSITEAARILNIQDQILKGVPEVERVFGKIGRAKTSTDPAPLSMVETVVTLKPGKEWRTGMTWERLIEEMDRKLQIPGMTNIWWMPIQTRTEMLATGVRSEVGIKVYGHKLDEIQRIALEIEGAVKAVPGTKSAFAERVAGGYYLDFHVNREKAARYGLALEAANEVIESAIGGMNISTTVEGRERYPITVRYARERRDNIDALRRVLVPTPLGAQVPLEQLAEISLTTGPSMITDENGSLVGTVFVDIEGRDLGGYVEEAKRVVTEQVPLPPGYRLGWDGQYRYMLRAQDNLTIIIPLTLLLICVLYYFNFGSVAQTLLVMLSLPCAVIGSLMALSLWGYHLSVAVWVGVLGLAGVAGETGVVMIVYLDQAYERRKREGRMNSLSDLFEAVTEGAILRLRPKIMTVATTVIGLLPLMWSDGPGADMMKRSALPIIGGMVTSTFLTLLIIPAIYVIWKEREISERK